MLRLVLLVSAILSFIYFLRPDTFPTKKQVEDTLGISTVGQLVNAEVVRQALIIHCINNQKLPTKLNQLYDNELSKDKYVDLDSFYLLKDKGNCEFDLEAQ